MRDHDDQAFPRDLADQFHNLYAGGGIERARRFVRQKDFGIVDQRAGDGHPLHLSARKLVGPLVHLLAQAYLFKRFGGALFAFCFRTARDRQGDFDVFQNRLLRNKVIRLKHKPDTVISIHVPVAVVVIFGGNTADNKVARGVLIQPADDV